MGAYGWRQCQSGIKVIVIYQHLHASAYARNGGMAASAVKRQREKERREEEASRDALGEKRGGSES